MWLLTGFNTAAQLNVRLQIDEIVLIPKTLEK